MLRAEKGYSKKLILFYKYAGRLTLRIAVTVQVVRQALIAK
jgi:hypothetical protein